MPETTMAATLGGVSLDAGDHLCVFYRGQEERDRLLLPFLAEGLRAGHAVLYLGREGEKDTIAARLGGRGNLEIGEPEDGHLRDGRYSPEDLFERLDDWVARTLSSGAAPFGRTAGDMSWASRLMSPGLVPELVGEEIAVTRWLRQYPLVVLCLYDLDLFGGELIIPMVKAHPKVWMAGTLVENPYYLRSTESVVRR
ncbi:MEDS domain-containing protein [Cryptosporangium phraense]|uniref:MEDS domain-containing protein n=1 Tax=Cryptosporangium phraense TaxID=2593070 RepID=A0A545AQG7_9ACTN|nr:MEDS domain-containing protein [Cryptosporangium phraense]TQS43481.1 hypothetical protein FL583_19855 [Cryptosporangium phraense]